MFPQILPRYPTIGTYYFQGVLQSIFVVIQGSIPVLNCQVLGDLLCIHIYHQCSANMCKVCFCKTLLQNKFSASAKQTPNAEFIAIPSF